MVNPANVMFPDRVNIPWINETCANSKWTTIEGTPSTNEEIVWSNWDKIVLENTRCDVSRLSKVMQTKTLRQAVMDCTEAKCKGVLYQKANDKDGNPRDIYTGTHKFGLCTRVSADTGKVSTVADNSYTLFEKGSSADATTDAGRFIAPSRASTTISVHFWTKMGPYNMPMVPILPSNSDGPWITDNGDAYQEVDGVEYGWHCPIAESTMNKPSHTPAKWDASVQSQARAAFLAAKAPCGTDKKTGTACEAGGWDPANPLSHEVDYKLLYYRRMQDVGNCNDGVKNFWEIKVEPGTYEVITVAGIPATAGTQVLQKSFVEGCVIENTRIIKSEQRGQLTLTNTIEVLDGKFTWENTGIANPFPGTQCTALTSFTLRRVAARLQMPWIPIVPTTSDQGAWWQIELDHRVPIGLVTINPYANVDRSTRSSNYDCRLWWMFADARCPGDVPVGTFRNSGKTTGTVVSVSDTPCSAHYCPTVGQHVCGSGVGSPTASIDTVPYDGGGVGSANARNVLMATQLNCDAKTGKFLRVWLPGPNRIFDASVSVNRASPVVPILQHDKVCAVKTMYGAPNGIVVVGAGGTKQVKPTGDGTFKSACSGALNENDDGTCCEATTSTLASSEPRGVRCCAARNPFKPKCVTKGRANIAQGAQGWVTRDLSSLWVDKNRNRVNPAKMFQDYPYADVSGLDVLVEKGNYVTVWCNPQCAILIDLEAVYSFDEIDWWGGGITDPNTALQAFSHDKEMIHNHSFYYYEPSGVGSGHGARFRQTFTLEDAMGSHASSLEALACV
jgi:hypothetical protein